MAQEIPSCPHCHSVLIVRDAIAHWDVTAQEWQLVGLLDNVDCSHCGADDITPNWLPVAELPSSLSR